MSQEELQRIKVIENTVAGRISLKEAAEYLNLSERQVKRLKQAHDAEDVNWVYHGNRGRSPANALDGETRQQVLDLAQGKYAGFNDTHLHEKLTKVEGLKLSRPSVQRMLREAKLGSPQKRRPPKYRSRHERREQEGMLQQLDGRRHDWLEGYMEMSLLVPGRKFVVVAGLSPAGEKAAKQRVRIKYSYGANEANGFRPVNQVSLGYEVIK